MLDLATAPQILTSIEPTDLEQPSIPDALFIVERGPNGEVALFVDPVRLDGTVSYTNQLESAVQLRFAGESPYADNPVNIPRGLSAPPFQQDVQPGIYSFVVEAGSSKPLTGGLQLALNVDGAASTSFIVEKDGMGVANAEIAQTIESMGMPAEVAFQTRPTQLSVTVEIVGRPVLDLGPKQPSGRIVLPSSPVQQRFIAKVVENEPSPQSRLAATPAGVLLQSGGNRQAEIIVDP